MLVFLLALTQLSLNRLESEVHVGDLDLLLVNFVLAKLDILHRSLYELVVRRSLLPIKKNNGLRFLI